MTKIVNQFVFKDKIFICGNATDVIKTLRELSIRFSTVKELLEYYTNGL